MVYTMYILVEVSFYTKTQHLHVTITLELNLVAKIYPQFLTVRTVTPPPIKKKKIIDQRILTYYFS